MSERDGFEPGVPCWVDVLQPETERAAEFYARLFGWEVSEQASPESTRRYFMCRLHGRDVAAVGSPPGDGVPPAWNTYVWVDSVRDAAARVTAAGGRVVVAPSESLDGGRVGVFADPAGAVFCAWEPGRHRGAQLVNEPGAWSMSLLTTDDPEGAEAFYGAVLGWETQSFGPATMWRLPGYVGGEPAQPVPRDVIAVMAPPTADVAPHWRVDFWVHDADAAAATARQLGGAVVAMPFDAPPFRSAVLADREGATFSVSELKVRGSSPRAGSARAPHDA